jgi:hypothetical protein
VQQQLSVQQAEPAQAQLVAEAQPELLPLLKAQLVPEPQARVLAAQQQVSERARAQQPSAVPVSAQVAEAEPLLR